jgi:hypothetical protein
VLREQAVEATYTELKTRWRAGERDRELALQLLYFAWMHWADPPFVTGMNNDEDAIPLWFEVFEFFGAEEASDAEFLHVTAIMGIITPDELGGEELWVPRIERLQARSRQLRPEGFAPEVFEGRGDYGDYFAHQARE